tara:strand:+ start:366 stop:623 length:258 start_codon:yes stop_codon:yes gene_type:complete
MPFAKRRADTTIGMIGAHVCQEVFSAVLAGTRRFEDGCLQELPIRTGGILLHERYETLDVFPVGVHNAAPIAASMDTGVSGGEME